MSVLIDATPVKRGTKKKEKVRVSTSLPTRDVCDTIRHSMQAPVKTKKEPNEKKSKKSTIQLSKDDEIIKRLKVLLTSL